MLKLAPPLLLATALAGAACGQEKIAEQRDINDVPRKWTGEGSLSGGFTTGNTETLDVGVALQVERAFERWAVGFDGSGDYGEADGEATRNRFDLALNADRSFNERFFSFIRTAYQEDDFSGFDQRAFVGVGVGYRIFVGETLNWEVQGAPGYRRDVISATLDENGEILVPSETSNSIGGRAASDFSYDFNDNVGFSNLTSVTASRISTEVLNTSALTASLTQRISARISFEVRFDTNPPLGFETTDTATRVSLVYGIGG